MGFFDIFKPKMKRSYLIDDKITDDEWKFLNKIEETSDDNYGI